MEKKRKISIIGLFLLIIMIGGAYISVQGDLPTSARFKGSLDTFYWNPDTKIVESRWHANIRDNEMASIVGKFTELNIINGEYDYFSFRMTGQYWTDEGDGIYIFTGTMHWEKNEEFWADIPTDVYIHPDDYNNQLHLDSTLGSMFGSILP